MSGEGLLVFTAIAPWNARGICVGKLVFCICIWYLYLVFGIWGEYLLDRTLVNILPSFPIHVLLLPRTLISQFKWMMNFDELLCTGKM